MDPQEGRGLRGCRWVRGKPLGGPEGAWGAVVSADTLCGGLSVLFYSCPTTTTAVIVTAARLQSSCVRAPGPALSAQDLIPLTNRSGGLRLAMVPAHRSPQEFTRLTARESWDLNLVEPRFPPPPPNSPKLMLLMVSRTYSLSCHRIAHSSRRELTFWGGVRDDQQAGSTLILEKEGVT